MKLLLRRDQRTAGMLGDKIVFSLEVRADLTSEERANVDKYRLAETCLYAKNEVPYTGPGLANVGRQLVQHATNVRVSVRDLTVGKKIECKDIMEMLAVEEDIKESARVFIEVLRAASHFGGEEVVEL